MAIYGDGFECWSWARWKALENALLFEPGGRWLILSFFDRNRSKRLFVNGIQFQVENRSWNWYQEIDLVPDSLIQCHFDYSLLFYLWDNARERNNSSTLSASHIFRMLLPVWNLIGLKPNYTWNSTLLQGFSQQLTFKKSTLFRYGAT